MEGRKDDQVVNDENFIGQVKKYRTAREFLAEEGVRITPEHVDYLDITSLYVLRFQNSGAKVTPDQWALLERAERILALYLTPDLRRKLRMRKTRVIVGQWPLVFLVGVLASFLVAVALPAQLRSIGWISAAAFSSLGAYLVWTISLGGLGASAFLAVNSLGIQSDTNFDMGDKVLIFTRLVVGCLFGFVLSLPISLPKFSAFAAQAVNSASDQIDLPIDTVALILLPFFLGFSTTLVLAVMNRFVAAVETFFGVKQTAPTAPPPSLPAVAPATPPPA